MCEGYIDWLPLTHPQLGTRPTSQACALTGNRTSDISVLRLALKLAFSPLCNTSQSPLFILIIHITEWQNYLHGSNKVILSCLDGVL